MDTPIASSGQGVSKTQQGKTSKEKLKITINEKKMDNQTCKQNNTNIMCEKRDYFETVCFPPRKKKKERWRSPFREVCSSASGPSPTRRALREISVGLAPWNHGGG